MNRSEMFIFVALALVLTSSAQTQQIRPSTILPASAAKDVSQFCSRTKPEFESGWVLTEKLRHEAETNLSLIPERVWKEQGIDDPLHYYRQYFGIVVGGRKLIYLNAVCKAFLKSSWRTKLVTGVCDGGCNWGAIYDPETHVFSEWVRDGAGPPPFPIPH
jgi:hypothetical protein